MKRDYKNLAAVILTFMAVGVFLMNCCLSNTTTSQNEVNSTGPQTEVVSLAEELKALHQKRLMT